MEKIIRAARETVEVESIGLEAPKREVLLSEVKIPDLWHVAMWLKDTDEVRTRVHRSTKLHPVDISLKAAGDEVLEVWHLCHDLLVNLRNIQR